MPGTVLQYGYEEMDMGWFPWPQCDHRPAGICLLSVDAGFNSTKKLLSMWQPLYQTLGIAGFFLFVFLLRYTYVKSYEGFT